MYAKFEGERVMIEKPSRHYASNLCIALLSCIIARLVYVRRLYGIIRCG